MNKRLIIIDGNSIINRAFFALPPMDNGEGLQTNAIYGFMTMLLKMIDTYKPTHMSVAFDVKAPTFRHKSYSEYKAGRKKMSDELFMQMEPLKNLLDALNINRMELAGFEADDIIGTVSKNEEKNDFEVIIVTGDRDAIQLASDKTTVLITKKGIKEVESYNYDQVIERYNLTPDQFIDLKGLMGDSSDNIPGIKGVGEKTGIKLLTEYKTVDGVIENIDKLKGALKKKVENDKEVAVMSKQLATIKRDVVLDYNEDDLIFGDFDIEPVVVLMHKFKFNTLVSRIVGMFGKTIDENEKEEVKIEKIKNDEINKFIEMAKNKSEIYMKLVPENGNVLEKNIFKGFISLNGEDVFCFDKEQVELFKEIFESEEISKIGFYLKEDYLLLKPYNITLKGMSFDVAIAEYLIDSKASTSYEISDLASKYLYKSINTEEDLLGKGKKKIGFNELPEKKLNEYFKHVLEVISKCKPIMEKSIDETKMTNLYYDLEMPLIEVLGSMEYIGISVDHKKLKELGEEFVLLIENLTKEIYQMAGEEFNINSPKQLGIVLFEHMGIPVVKKTKTGYSTNVDVLEKLVADGYEIANKIIEYRKIVKLNSTYVEGLETFINDKDGRIHSSFNQTITTTGRISSTDPNLQNIPVRTSMGRNIRKIFVSTDGCQLVDADYSQVELRVLAHMSGDEHMIEAFEHGEDIHRKTASQVFDVDIKDVTPELRSAAKAVNFGIIYGKSDFGLSKDLEIPIYQAKEYINSYFAKYEKIKTFMDEIVADAEDKGYATTIFSRRRYIPEIKSSNFMNKNRGKRAAMNAPIQGSAADIIKIAMVNVFNRLEEKGFKSKLILQVHDELIVEACEDEVKDIEVLLRDEMENAVNLKVKLDVDLNSGKSWYETK